jgi:hypothetical protein
MIFSLMPFCPLLAERIEQLERDLQTLDLEGCHAITGTTTISLIFVLSIAK